MIYRKCFYTLILCLIYKTYVCNRVETKEH